MKLHYLILTAAVATMMVGCEDRQQIAQEKIDEIRRNPPKQPEPIPIFTPVETFIYGANNLRSPYIPYSIAQEIKTMAGRKVYPNQYRSKEVLEGYELETLLLQGTIQNKNGVIEALIKVPTPTVRGESVVSVRRGNYIGLNHGRIVNITPTKGLKPNQKLARVDLLEIVPDGRGAYIERPRTLVLLETPLK